MFVQQLFEGTAKRVIVVYPGRFQPFHLGHKEVFEALQAKFGSDNVYIGTSNKVTQPKSPFNFSEKLQLINAAGIPSNHVIEVVNPYQPDDYINAIGFDPAQTIMIFAVGEPDLARLEVDATYTEKTPTGRPSKIPAGKQVGDPKPFKSFQSIDQSLTADQHQYVMIAKERPKTITVNGKKFDASHGTKVREIWNQVRNDPKASAEVMQQLYGTATPEIAHILNKIQDVNAPPEPVAKPSPKLNKVDETSLASRYADDYAYQQAQMNKPASTDSIHDIIARRDVKAYQNWKQENPNDPMMPQLKAAEHQGTEAMAGIQPMGKALGVLWKTVFDVLSQSNQGVAEGSGSNRNYSHGFASPHAPSLGGRREREDDEGWEQEEREKSQNWYIRIDGKLLKDKQHNPYTFRGKEAARKAALTMMAKDFNRGKKFTLTTSWMDAPKVMDESKKKDTGINKDDETKFHAKLDKLVHDTFGKRKAEKHMAEDDHAKHLHLHHKKNRFKTLKKIQPFEADMDESLYQYDKQDPYNSEFAPDVGMGRMTLRGWKQSMIRRVKEFATELERSGGDLDRDAMWDHVYKKLQSLNLDPIAREIELAHQELDRIRRQGGIRSRAFKK